MEKRPSSKRSPGKSVLFVVLTWIVALVLVEAGVRIVHPEAGGTVYPGYPAGLVVPNNELGHSYAPGYAGYFPAPRYRDIPIRINPLGFRDLPWQEKPEPNRPRVMVLGDSITFGSPLRQQERFTEHAAAVLADRGLPVETCNCGVNEYNVEQYAILLRILAPVLKPRIVLVGFCLNDAGPIAPSDARRIEIASGLKHGSAWARTRAFAEKYRLDLHQSYAFNLARRAIKVRLWNSDRYGPVLMESYEKRTRDELEKLYSDGSGIGRLRNTFSVMKQFASEELDAQLAVVLFAYNHQLQARDPKISRKAGDVLRELKIPYVDLYDVFLPHAGSEGFYAYQDDCHPGAPGHRIAGEAAADLIHGILSPSDRPSSEH